VFLKVLLEQAAILRKEMESADVNEVPMASCAAEPDDDGPGAVFRTFMTMRAT